jgi:hypothetical protein
MRFPVYCIINDKAVKAVKTKRGEVEVLVFDPEEDDFRRDMRFLDYIYLPSPSRSLATDTVSKKEFEAYVAELRRSSKTTHPIDDQKKQKRVIDRIVDRLKGKIRNKPDIRQQRDPIRKWTLEGYDTYACEFYQIKGEYETKSEAIAAARKMKIESGEQIFLVAPNGSHKRLR